MQQYNVIATTTVRPRQQQEQLRKTTIQTTIQHVAHLPVVDVDDATTAAAATCVHLNSSLATFLIPKEQLGKQNKNHGPPQPRSHEEPNSNNDHSQMIIVVIIKISFCVSRY